MGDILDVIPLAMVIIVVLDQLVRVVKVLQIAELVRFVLDHLLEGQDVFVLLFRSRGLGGDKADLMLEDLDIVENLGLGVLLFLGLSQKLRRRGIEGLRPYFFLALHEQFVAFVIEVIGIILRRGRESRNQNHP